MKSLQVEDAVKPFFEEEVQLTGIMEYGISWEEFLSGAVPPPAQGARFDIAFEGKLFGSEFNGTVKGVDYLEIRADGKFMLNIQATIITHDGEAIALKEDGILTLNQEGSAQLHLNMKLSTASQKYEWLNSKQIWGIGEVNMQEGRVSVKGYVS